MSTPKRSPAATVSPVVTPGEVQPSALYTLRELQRRLGLGSHAIRSARRAGLRVLRVSGRAFVLGGDAIAWIVEHGEKK